MSGRQTQLTSLRAVNSDLYRQLNELRAAKDAEIAEWKQAHDNLAMQLTIQSDEVQRLTEGMLEIREDISESLIHPSDVVVVNKWLDSINALLFPAGDTIEAPTK